MKTLFYLRRRDSVVMILMRIHNTFNCLFKLQFIIICIQKYNHTKYAHQSDSKLPQKHFTSLVLLCDNQTPIKCLLIVQQFQLIKISFHCQSVCCMFNMFAIIFSLLDIIIFLSYEIFVINKYREIFQQLMQHVCN